MTIFEQSLKTLDVQFKTAADALAAQYKVATEAVLLALEAAYNVKIHELDACKGVKNDKVCHKIIEPEPVACEAGVASTTTLKATSTTPPPFYAPGIDTRPSVPLAAVPVKGPPAFYAPPWSYMANRPAFIPVVPPRDTPSPVIASPIPPLMAATAPPPFYAPALVQQPTCAPTFAPLPEQEDVGEVMEDETPEEIAQERREYPIQTAQVGPGLESVKVAPPPFVAPPAQDIHAESVTIGRDGVVHVAWAPGTAPTPPPFDLSALLPKSPVPPTSPTPETVADVGNNLDNKVIGKANGDVSLAGRFVSTARTRGSNYVPPAMEDGKPKLASMRSAELRAAARPELKALLHIVYVGPNGRPLMTYPDVIDMDTDAMIDAILAHEIAKGWVTGEHGAVN
jgi:hypothetical protein